MGFSRLLMFPHARALTAKWPFTCQRVLFAAAVLVLVAFMPAFPAQGTNAAAPEPGLTALLDRESAPVGGTLTLTLNFSLPEGAHLPPDPSVSGLEGLTVLDRRVSPGQIQFVLMIDRIGSWSTGPLSLPYSNADGERKVLTADPVSVTVLSNLGEKPEEASLRPIQGIVRAKTWWLRHWPWALALCGLAVAAAVSLWWYRKFRRKRVKASLEDPPHLWARKALEELEAGRLFEEGAVKAFYFRLSEILRRYVEAIRGFPAAEYTTEEIARRVRLPEDRALIPLLKRIDLVKFAGVVPARGVKDEEMRAALAYVRETAPPSMDGAPAPVEAPR